MARIKIVTGFSDPAQRPRYILWSGAILLFLVAFMAVAIGVTSTNWFCANACHKVQDDTIIAFERSSHSELACMACHSKVGSGPIYFVLHKVEALGEMYLTVTNTYSLPLNPVSHVALSASYFSEKQCTQCHNLSKRPVTPSVGIIINHEVHSEENVHCTVCHNRVAHREDFDLTLTDPLSGEPNQKHDDFMEMAACFRCHTQSDVSPSGIMAPGECGACHPPSFDLKPANHYEAGFYEQFGDSSGHAALAVADLERRALGAERAAAAGHASEATATAEDDGDDTELHLVSMSEVGYCATCHEESTFCESCHGIQMPHPVDFPENHGDDGRNRPQVCENCHAPEAGADFCNACHHAEGDATQPWLPQHSAIASATEEGIQGCFECHAPTYCAECHVRGGIADAPQ